MQILCFPWAWIALFNKCTLFRNEWQLFYRKCMELILIIWIIALPYIIWWLLLEPNSAAECVYCGLKIKNKFLFVACSHTVMSYNGLDWL